MKIGFVLDDGLDVPDGVQQYVLTLGEWFTGHGHDVHYLVGQTSRDDIPNIHSLGKNVSVRFNGNRLSIPYTGSTAQLKDVLSRQAFDVLHVQMPYSPQLAGKVIKYANPHTAVVGTFHILPYGKMQAAGTWLLSKVVASSLKRFDAFVAVSSAAKKFADSYIPKQSVVVPNAVNLAKFSKGTHLKKYQDGKQSIVFLGRLVERKGALELLKAVRILIHSYEYTNVRVVIVGHGPQRKKLEQYISRHSLEEFVDMVGWITEADKPNYLCSSDVAVFPSLSGESFGIVLVEAIAAGAGVVLGGDNPGYRYVLDNQADALVNPSNSEQFAQQLHKLLTQSTIRRSLQAKLKKRIRSFDVGIVGPTLLEIYTKEIAKRTHNRNNSSHEYKK